MTGIAALAWGVLSILFVLAGFVFAASAFQGGQAGAAALGSTAIVVKVVSLLAALALCWMLFQLSQIYGGGMGAMACYAAIALTILQQILQFANVTGFLAIIVFVLQGVSLVLVGVFGLMGKRLLSGSFKAFCILMIITGACLAVVLLGILYPFLALATGIVAFVAFNGAAKTVPA